MTSGKFIKTLTKITRLNYRHKEENRIADKEIDRYSLILFDFDRADLRPEHREMIALVRAGLTPESVVTVRGFTDDFDVGLCGESFAHDFADNGRVVDDEDAHGLQADGIDRDRFGLAAQVHWPQGA